MCFTLRLHTSAAPPRGGLTQALGPMSNSVPPAFKIQMARLFGATSAEAKNEHRTIEQWRKTLQKSLDEIYAYTEANIETDDIHWLMICSAFASAHAALKEDFFWPGFIEGLVRLNLLVLGDYPDHRKRKGGKKKSTHYSLNSFRSLHYLQDSDQKLRVLYAQPRLGFPELSISPLDAMSIFRNQHGYQASHREFMKWYKKNYPKDYASIF